MASTLPTVISSIVSSLPSGSDTPSPAPVSSISIVPSDSFTPSIITSSSTTAPVTGWAKLISPDYYFNTSPFDHAFLWGRPLALLFTILLIICFAILIRALLPRMKHRMQWRATAYWLMFFGLMGDTLLFFRWQHVPVLSMRIWLILLLLGFVAWILMRAWGMIDRQRTRRASPNSRPLT